MQYFDATQIKSLLSPSEIINIVRAGMVKAHNGIYKIPQRLHLENKALTFLVMPAMGPKYFCTKLVSVTPRNPTKGLPLISGTLILNDAQTGKVLAQMDAGMITNLRTAAVGAIGLELISPEHISSIGIIGCGNQGIWQTIFAAEMREIKNVFCFNRSAEKFENYKREVATVHPSLNLIWCSSADEVVQKSEVIYGCTQSEVPIFSNNKKMITRKKFISVGSFKPEMQEFPGVVYEQADLMIIDSGAARTEVGDVINALENNWMDGGRVIELGEILSKGRRLDVVKDLVFKSVGMAAFDLALAEGIWGRWEEGEF